MSDVPKETPKKVETIIEKTTETPMAAPTEAVVPMQILPKRRQSKPMKRVPTQEPSRICPPSSTHPGTLPSP